jgi:hypothetical protein
MVEDVHSFATGFCNVYLAVTRQTSSTTIEIEPFERYGVKLI